MLPKSLQKILDTTDYPEYDIDILNLDISADPLKMEFVISDTEGSNDRTIVSMTAFGNTDFYIDREGLSSYIHLEHDSPLLWRFKDTQCELYVSSGQSNQIDKVIFDLLQIHYSLFGQYLSFDLEIVKILNNGHGLLKKGPKKLLTQFADSLNKNGIATSIISEINPGKEKQGLMILFIGHTYIVADKFEFEIRK